MLTSTKQQLAKKYFHGDSKKGLEEWGAIETCKKEVKLYGSLQKGGRLEWLEAEELERLRIMLAWK